jgi:itaconyl-CoA hydratase
MPKPELLEGLPIGVVERSRGRTITDGEFAILTSLTWTTGQMHANREFMQKRSQFKERILGGPVVVAVASGIQYQSHWHRFAEKYQVKAIAAVGVDAKYRGPVFPNDTLYVDVCLAEARPSRSRQGQGVLVFDDKVVNQKDELVLEMKRTLIFERTEEPYLD